VKGTSQARVTGLVAVRIAWIMALAVCGLAILIGLLTGTGSGDPSQQLPGFAFSAGPDSSQQSPQSPGFTSLDPAAAMSGAAAQKDRGRRAKEGGDSHSGSGVPHRSGSQPEDTSGATPVVTPRPKPPKALGGDPAEAPQAPSVAPQKPPKPSEPTPAPPVISPEPTPAPPVISPEPAPAPVTPSEPPKSQKSPKPLKPPKP
jgi:hypothetical protein